MEDLEFETPSKIFKQEDSIVLKTDEHLSKSVNVNKKRCLNGTIDSIFKPFNSLQNLSKCADKMSFGNNDSIKSVSSSSSSPLITVIKNSFIAPDIGYLLDTTNTLSGQEKLNLLENVWMPPSNYKFPVTIFHGKNGSVRKGSCQEKYLKKYNKSEKYKTLVYSATKDVLFCLPCLLFRNLNVGKEEKLFSEGLCYWPSVTEKLKNHFTPSTTTTRKLKHHELAVTAMEYLLKTSHRPEKNIRSYINAAECGLIKRNREYMKLIFEMVLYLGQQGNAFRGHRDDLEYVLDVNINAGNFAELLNLFARCNNETAINILHKMPKSASYSSPTILKECIEIIGETILSKLSEKVNKSRWFSILADEASDITSTEQMALCVRFLNDERKIEERFLIFVECGHSQSGENISKTILDTLNKLDIDMNNCRGQGYDGAGAMAGSVRGVAKRISDLYLSAPYCHCCSHKLNLCVLRMIKIELVRNTFDVSHLIADFFTDNAKEKRLYESTAREMYPDRPEKVRKLIDFCRTRWCEQINGLQRFVECFDVIHATLRKIKDNISFESSTWNKEVVVMATGLFANIKSLSFIVSLVVSKEVLSYTSGITSGLQAKSSTLVSAYSEIGNVIMKLKDVRSRVETYHSVWYESACKIVSSIETYLDPGQIDKYNDANSKGDPISIFFLREITAPLLDEVINEIEARFNEKSNKYIDAFNVIPSVIRKKEGKGDEWKITLEKFMMDRIDDMDDVSTLNAELDLWESRWKSIATSEINEKYATIQNLLDTTEPAIYPNISRVLELLAVFPPTTCTCERSISRIRRLKTPLRASMEHERFSALALMMTHRDVDLNVDELINRLAIKYPKRLRMLHPISDNE